MTTPLNNKFNKITFWGFVLLLMGFILLNPLTATAQEDEEVVEDEEVERQTVSLTELLKILQSKDDEIIISDLDITVGSSDNSIKVDKIFYSVYELTPNDKTTKKIYFYNCSFNTGNSNPVVFSNWSMAKFNMINCKISTPLTFENIETTGNYPVHFENCKFYNSLSFKNENSELNKLEFENCLFKKDLKIETDVNSILINGCEFYADTGLYKNEDEEKTLFQLKINNRTIGNFKLKNSKFNSSDIKNLFSISFRNNTFENIFMFNDSLSCIDLSMATVEKSLLIDSLLVSNYIGILNFDFPDNNTNIPWYNIGGEKLALLTTSDNSELLSIYQAKTKKQLSNTLDYNDLMSAYSKFNAMYHGRGDIVSANESYVEIKTIETRRQAYMQEVSPSLNNLINYKLNVFLSYFSDFATNPGKSLIQSIWVILFFTFLYMITYSGWDGMNYKYYVTQFKQFTEYIVTDKPIDEVFKEKNDENAGEEEIFSYYLKNGKKVPKVLRLFGKPLHLFGRYKTKFIPAMLKLFDFQPKKWEDIKGFKKLWSGIVILLISFLFIVYVIVVKFINSLIISLNCFIVIGFGALPEQDNSIAMYLSIIEGIIGWFLLTIFSITLLSQVLQAA